RSGGDGGCAAAAQGPRNGCVYSWRVLTEHAAVLAHENSSGNGYSMDCRAGTASGDRDYGPDSLRGDGVVSSRLRGAVSPWHPALVHGFGCASAGDVGWFGWDRAGLSRRVGHGAAGGCAWHRRAADARTIGGWCGGDAGDGLAFEPRG